MTTYFRCVTIFIFIALAWSFAAQGGILYSSNTSFEKNQTLQLDTIVSDLSVAARLPDHVIAVNESKKSTFEFPVTVTNGGRMNLISVKSIVLKPGTRVVAGGYFRVAIVSDSREQKPGIRKFRKLKKTTVAETALAPIVIAETHDTISPFAKKSEKAISESDNKEESLAAQISDASGISPEQNRKLAGYSTTKMSLMWNRIVNSCHYHFIPLSENHETIAVLRL